jgi:hypothetical protein
VYAVASAPRHSIAQLLAGASRNDSSRSLSQGEVMLGGEQSIPVAEHTKSTEVHHVDLADQRTPDGNMVVLSRVGFPDLRSA